MPRHRQTKLSQRRQKKHDKITKTFVNANLDSPKIRKIKAPMGTTYNAGVETWKKDKKGNWYTTKKKIPKGGY